MIVCLPYASKISFVNNVTPRFGKSQSDCFHRLLPRMPSLFNRDLNLEARHVAD